MTLNTEIRLKIEDIDFVAKMDENGELTSEKDGNATQLSTSQLVA